MEYIKHIFNSKSLKLPNHITSEQLEYGLIGSLTFSLSVALYYFVFGKLIGKQPTNKPLHQNLLTRISLNLNVVAGILFCSAYVKELHHEHFTDFYPFDSKNYIKSVDESVLVVGGFLIGISGGFTGDFLIRNSIIGVSLRKTPSIITSILFIASAFLVNRYHISTIIIKKFQSIDFPELSTNINPNIYINATLCVPFLLFILYKDKSVKGMIKYILNFLIGVILAIGLMIAGITQIKIVVNGLDFRMKMWNVQIVVFYIGVVVFTSTFLSILKKIKMTPVFSQQFDQYEELLTVKLIISAIIYGIGFGLTGICPFSMLVFLPLPNLKFAAYWLCSYILGRLIVQSPQLLKFCLKITNKSDSKKPIE